VGLQAVGHEVSVAVLYPGGQLEAGLRGAGVPILSTDKEGRYDLLSVFWRLVRTVRHECPAFSYGVITAANLLSAALRPLLRRIRNRLPDVTLGG
jgi:hypothetical protein